MTGKRKCFQLKMTIMLKIYGKTLKIIKSVNLKTSLQNLKKLKKLLMILLLQKEKNSKDFISSQMTKCDTDGDDAISMDYDMIQNKDQCLTSCFKRRAFKNSFFPDCE